MFKPIALYWADGYKVGHYMMLAPGTRKLYGTWIPRNIKHAPKGIRKIMSFGQQLTVRWLNENFKECFFALPPSCVEQFGKDMSLYLGLPYEYGHFTALYNLGYLPIRVKALPEGIETNPNIPHATFINTVDGFAWLTLYLETIFSALSWKASTSATIAKQYNRNTTEWVMKTCPSMAFLIPFLNHDFSARGMDPYSMMTSGLGHATSSRGSDTLIVIPAARHYYDEPEDSVAINSVNASEHSVSTTKIFTVGESQMLADWIKLFPKGILSIVSDTFDLWKLITMYLVANKQAIMDREGTLVVRPDSGDPVDIICGTNRELRPDLDPTYENAVGKGVVELLWDIFGGTIVTGGDGKQYKVLDSHIGSIYGDSINLDRQIQIFERLAEKGFACCNVVLGVGSFTYQFNTRDTLGYAAKGAWFTVLNEDGTTSEFDIYKEPITDDGGKVCLRGRVAVHIDEHGEYVVQQHCTAEEEAGGILQTIFEDGKYYNQTTLAAVRERVAALA